MFVMTKMLFHEQLTRTFVYTNINSIIRIVNAL